MMLFIFLIFQSSQWIVGSQHRIGTTYYLSPYRSRRSLLPVARSKDLCTVPGGTGY